MPFKLTLEHLYYLLVLTPLFAGRLVVALVILGLLLLMRHARGLARRTDSLRKTMNEAIIHDLKNPMAAVMGCLSCALGDEMSAEQRAKLLAIALHSCRVQMSLLETLVDTSRLENGELVARRQVLDSRVLFAACLKDSGGTARHLGVELKSEISDDIPPTVSVDPELFPRAVYNLLHNALKYSPPRGVVSLSVAFGENEFKVEINDTGVGIAPEHISRLFQKYYRVEGADQTSRRGSGLGLYFCRLVVEAHGGAISVSSAVGRGTTVAFTIPQAARTGASSHDRIAEARRSRDALA